MNGRLKNREAIKSAFENEEKRVGPMYAEQNLSEDVRARRRSAALGENLPWSFERLDANNNAGVQNFLADTADTTAEDYDRVMGVNHVLKAATGQVVSSRAVRQFTFGLPRRFYSAS